jgi:hypothetical protein
VLPLLLLQHRGRKYALVEDRKLQEELEHGVHRHVNKFAVPTMGHMCASRLEDQNNKDKMVINDGAVVQWATQILFVHNLDLDMRVVLLMIDVQMESKDIGGMDVPDRFVVQQK